MFAVSRNVYKLILDNGSCPLDEFLAHIKDKVTRARIVRQIDKGSEQNQ